MYRPLEDYPRDQDTLEVLDKVLDQTLGNEYGLNPGKFLRKTKNIKDENGESMIGEDRKFHCSELVAKAYKELGLLDLETNSS